MQSDGSPFHGIATWAQATLHGQNKPPETIGGHDHSCMEVLTLEMEDSPGAYYVALGCQRYAKFMATPDFACLRLEAPRSHKIIDVGGDHATSHISVNGGATALWWPHAHPPSLDDPRQLQ